MFKRLTSQQWIAARDGCRRMGVRGNRQRSTAKRLLKFRKSKAPDNRPIRVDTEWPARRVHEVELQMFIQSFGI